jgi:Ca-activated chloride channel family protein
VILVKLSQKSLAKGFPAVGGIGQREIKLKVSYKDRNGVPDSDEARIEFAEAKQDFYQNSGIRKAILLSRYADLLKDWTVDERKASQMGGRIIPTVTLANGIVIPVELGEWERQSLPLQVSEPYQEIFCQFKEYFQSEERALEDSNLEQEQAVLGKLCGFQGSGRLSLGS